MSSDGLDIDLEIKNYFTHYLIQELHLSEIHYEIVKPKRRCVFKIRINGVIENLVIEYQEDFIGEYSVYFKTTANVEFFENFLKPILKTKTIDYPERFQLMLNAIEQTGKKFKVFNTIVMLDNSVLSTRVQLDKSTLVEYHVIGSHRNFSMKVNEKLYPHLKKLHYFKSMIYFTFKQSILSANCLIFNQSMSNDNVDEVELWLSGNENVFTKNLRTFQKNLENFTIHELFQPIHVHCGIPFSELITMTEDELMPYVDIVKMIRI